MKKSKETIYVAILIDQSGSMNACKNDTIGGFNQFLKDQKESKLGDLKLSLTFFNSVDIEKRYVEEDIHDIPDLTDETFIPLGTTPLWDALGDAISAIPQKRKDVFFVVITDGFENSSRERSAESVKQMINKKKKQGWLFEYLGVNIKDFGDAFIVGIKSQHRVSSATSYPTVSASVTSYRSMKTK